MAVLTKITSRSLADNAVTAAHVQPDALAAGDIAAGAIGSSELADDAVGTNQLANDVVVNTSGNITTTGTGALTIAGTAAITGNATAGGTLGVTGNTTVGGTLGITGNTTVGGTLGVTGALSAAATTLTGNLLIPNAGNIGSASDPDAIAIASNGDVTITQALRVTGDLVVDGTNTTVNSTTLQIDDKHIELAHSPSGSEGADASIDGGGIILKSSDSDKSIQWYDATDAWTFNQHIFPEQDNARDLGSTTKRFRNIYTTDLHLSNERGNWTVIEEEDYLTLRNNKTNKVYKLVMEEIE